MWCEGDRLNRELHQDRHNDEEQQATRPDRIMLDLLECAVRTLLEELATWRTLLEEPATWRLQGRAHLEKEVGPSWSPAHKEDASVRGWRKPILGSLAAIAPRVTSDNWKNPLSLWSTATWVERATCYACGTLHAGDAAPRRASRCATGAIAEWRRALTFADWSRRSLWAGTAACLCTALAIEDVARLRVQR